MANNLLPTWCSAISPQPVLLIGFQILVPINTSHLDHATLTTSEPYLGNDNLHVGDGNGFPISHLGHIKIYTPHRSFTLSNVLHVPAIMKPLLSIQKFYLDNNVYFEFHTHVFYVKDFNTYEVLLSGYSKDGLYALTKFSVTSVPQAYWSPCTSASADLWHRRLGHPTSRIFNC